MVLAATGPYRGIQEQPIARFGIDAQVEAFSMARRLAGLSVLQIKSGSGASGC